MMPFRAAASLEDLWGGEMIAVSLGGTRILLVNVAGEIHAYEDRCAHLGVPLSEGRLDETILTCSAHLWQYDVRTGRGVNPAAACLRSFSVRVQDGRILVDLDR